MILALLLALSTHTYNTGAPVTSVPHNYDPLLTQGVPYYPVYVDVAPPQTWSVEIVMNCETRFLPHLSNATTDPIVWVDCGMQIVHRFTGAPNVVYPDLTSGSSGMNFVNWGLDPWCDPWNGGNGELTFMDWTITTQWTSVRGYAHENGSVNLDSLKVQSEIPGKTKFWYEPTNIVDLNAVVYQTPNGRILVPQTAYQRILSANMCEGRVWGTFRYFDVNGVEL